MSQLLAIAIFIVLFYVTCLCGRKSGEGKDFFYGWSFAHRGLHGDGIPENSMPAFREALEGDYGIELDIHLMKDGNLAVIHDSSLKRTAGADVRIEDLTAQDLENYPLGDTQETIPLFSQVLELFDGKAPMIIELKSEGGNHAALCQAACDLMEHYPGPYCMESFDPRCIYWLRKHRPGILRGQLSHNQLSTKSKTPWIFKFLLTFNLLNCFTVPDFIAYRYSDRKTLSNFICRNVLGMMSVSWTLRTQEEYDTAVKEGWIPIFEGFRP